MTDIRNDRTTTTTTTTPTGRPMMQWAVVAWLISVVLTAIGTFSELVDGSGDSSEDGSDEFLGWAVMMAVLALIAFVVYRYWFERAAEAPVAPNTVLIAGVLAAVTVLAFWSGLPALFAVGALVLGRRGGGAPAVIGMLLSAAALLVCVYAAFYG